MKPDSKKAITNTMEGLPMAPQKIAQRKRAMRVADAVNKMEGIPVRSYAIELSNAWCEGKITGAQMKEALRKSHMEMARRVK